MIQRSKDGGKSWEAVGNQFDYVGDRGTHQSFDGKPHAWKFKRVWHLEPAAANTPTWCMRALKMPRSSARRTPGRPGRSCPGCGGTSPDQTGIRGLAGSAYEHE